MTTIEALRNHNRIVDALDKLEDELIDHFPELDCCIDARISEVREDLMINNKIFLLEKHLEEELNELEKLKEE